MSKTCTIKIDLGNAAFDNDNGPHELARILRECANRLERDAEIVTHGGKHVIRDVNGNTCGKLWISS